MIDLENKTSLTLEECNELMRENGGDLKLSHTSITSLPDNLTVDGSLWIINTPISSLPNNLTVNGSLYINETDIKSLSSEVIKSINLNVKGSFCFCKVLAASYADVVKYGICEGTNYD